MKYLICVGVVACVVTIAAGLQCHQCQTLEYKTCRDPYTVDNLDDCDDDQYCVKYKTVVKIKDSGYINGWERYSQVVTRSCEPRQGKKEGCIGWQNNGGITLKCWCGSDGCNSSSLPVPMRIFIAVSSLLALCLFRFLH